MGRIFGTDGARGVANTEISCKLAMNIGRAAAMVVAERLGHKPAFIIGKDTRISSDMLEAAVTAGLCSVGADVHQAGIMPTPAVSYLISEGYADAGIMLSASHNPYEFNGIKIFGPGGRKLSDAEEFEIEEIILDKIKPYSIRWGWELGRISRSEDLLDKYVDHLAQTVQEDLSGLRVAVDCSNGSASATAARLFERLGVEATILHAEPNGININRNCGSTHIGKLCEYVREGDFDAGIAYDGDADRCMAADELGNVIDGDKIMAIIAADMKARGALHQDTLVATVMSNLGLFKFAEQNGIHVETTKVGDRYVLENMMKNSHNLGGEQSGHVILLDHMNTGDGQLSSITLLGILKRSGRKLSQLGGIMHSYPQVMKNIQADSLMKSKLGADKGVDKLIEDANARLGGDGRILIRASGTEPLIRVMIEGKELPMIEQLAQELAEQLKERLSNNEDCKKLEGF